MCIGRMKNSHMDGKTGTSTFSRGSVAAFGLPFIPSLVVSVKGFYGACR
jgi:hypothetical protein